MERQTSLISGIRVLAMAAVAVLMVPASGQGQTGNRGPAPKTAWGHPDLQGLWTNTTTTPLERPADLADKAVLSEAERGKRDAEVAERVSFDRRSAGNVGAYNEFWMERGALNNRTSLVIDPPDGKIPPMTPAGKARQDAVNAHRREHPADSWEDRSAYDRCITRGIPGVMVPGFYNHNYHILQTPTHVVLVAEMIHDARIIPIDGRPHLPSTIRQWLGDSRGRWEGDTLVVETRNVTDKVFDQSLVIYGFGAATNVVERFRRTGPDTLDYEFTVNVPEVYTRPWTVSTPMAKMDGQLYEYACHEGNHAMPNILNAERAADAAKKK